MAVVIVIVIGAAVMIIASWICLCGRRSNDVSTVVKEYKSLKRLRRRYERCCLVKSIFFLLISIVAVIIVCIPQTREFLIDYFRDHVEEQKLIPLIKLLSAMFALCMLYSIYNDWRGKTLCDGQLIQVEKQMA